MPYRYLATDWLSHVAGLGSIATVFAAAANDRAAALAGAITVVGVAAITIIQRLRVMLRSEDSRDYHSRMLLDEIGELRGEIERQHKVILDQQSQLIILHSKIDGTRLSGE